MSFDIDGARKAGYSDAEITQFLAADKSTSFDVKGALDAGYSPEEVVGELTKHPAFAAGKQELEDAAKSPAANHFTSAMPRDQYEKQFLATNPQASRAALDAVLAQYDQQADARSKATGGAVQDKFAALQTPEAMFNARLNERLQGPKNGVVPQLPGRISPDMPHVQTPANRLREELAHELAVEQGQHPQPLPPSNVNPQDYQDMLRPRASGPGTVATNAAMGLWGTVMGAEATGASLLGQNEVAAQLDAARARGAEVARLNGGGTILGKTANLAGAIAPAMVSGGAGLAAELAGNAGLFGSPAARDAYREQKAKGASEAVAIEHAMAAMGINTALPMIAPGGSRAITGMLGAAEAGGLKGVGVQLAQAAGEGAGFAVANSASHKAIDAANGIQTADPWVNLHELPSEALAFAALRGAHIAGHGVGSVAAAIQQARAQRALIDNIGRAGSVDEAIAAATAAVSAKPAADNVADVLQQIRPLNKPAPEAAVPAIPTDALGRVEPVLGETSSGQIPAHAGMSDILNQEAIHAAAPAEGSDGGTGGVVAGRPGETVGERPAATGPVPGGPEALDALPRPAGGADPVRADASTERELALGDGWHAFPAESGTLGIPRADMPQIASEHRGPMVNFLNARGIAHEQVEIPADRLKPTQAEFNLDKVQKAHDFTGDGRSILVSSDGHVLDGHHQWLAAVEKGEAVKAIRLDAPIRDLLAQVKEFPSATVAGGAPKTARAPSDLLKTAKRDTRLMGSVDDPVAREIMGTPGFDKLDAELAKHGIETTGVIGAGAGSVVLDAGKHVVRIGRGDPEPVPKVDGMLQPVHSGSVGGIRYDIMPKAETKGITEADVAQVAAKLKTQGYEFSDAGTDNVGKINGVPVVIDPGAITEAKANHLDAAREKHQRQDEAVRLAAEKNAQRKATGGERARERVANENPFLHFLATHGISIKDRADTGAEKGRTGNPMVPGFGPFYRKSGLRLDELALAAKEAGFLTEHDIEHPDDTGGTNKLAEMIGRALGRKEVIQKATAVREPSADEQLHAEAQKLGIETEGKSSDQVYDEVIAAHAKDYTYEQAEIVALAEQDADIPLDGGTPSNHLTDEEVDARFGIRTAGEAEGRGRQDQESTASTARGADEGTGKAGQGQDLLSGYTREEVVARQDADAARIKQKDAERAKLEAARKKETDDKDVRARMDASADDFQLGQDAHDSLAGQKDIFSDPAPAAEPAAPKAADPLDGIPRTFLKKTSVEHQAYNAAEKRWDTAHLPADQALKAVREDISHLEAMLKCMKG